MEINIEDYLTHDEIKDAVRDAVKGQARSLLKDEANLQRLISNQAYDVVHKMVDSILDGDLAVLLRDKVKEIFDGMGIFEVFRKPNAWDREPNDAYKHLQKSIESQFPRIEQIVKDMIEPETIKHLKADLSEYIIEAVQNLYKTEAE